MIYIKYKKFYEGTVQVNNVKWLAVSIVVSISKKETPEALKIKGSGRIVIIPTS